MFSLQASVVYFKVFLFSYRSPWLPPIAIKFSKGLVFILIAFFFSISYNIPKSTGQSLRVFY